MKYNSLDWYKRHPEVVVRHHGTKWSDLHIHILLQLFNNKERIEEMSRMLGRTEYGILYQLTRQKVIWFDKRSFTYYVRSKNQSPRKYDGVKFL